MSFTISGLSPEPFRYFSELSDEALRERNIIRRIADSKPGFPCRITLEDAEPGETVFLLNHESHSASTPYASRYAIYVRENAATPALFRDELPLCLSTGPSLCACSIQRACSSAQIWARIAILRRRSSRRSRGRTCPTFMRTMRCMVVSWQRSGAQTDVPANIYCGCGFRRNPAAGVFAAAHKR
jgi:hypothetical protein